VAEEVAAAVGTSDANVEIGGATLAATAIGLGLVDELRIFRHPVVIGGGTPYLPAVTEHVPLDLVETRTFDGGVVYERYRRAASA
jgi:dihydrofolate reductase